jgi:co-chaperonin GroES (HSP10)
MATLTKSPIKTKSKIKILYIADTAKEKPQQGKILSTAYVN